MYRRIAGLLLLPVILFLMTTKARSYNHAPKSAKANGASAERGQGAASPGKLNQAQQEWVDSTLQKMSVEEKVGQLLFATYHGSFTATDSTAYAQMLHSVNDLHVGGFINVTHMSPWESKRVRLIRRQF